MSDAMSDVQVRREGDKVILDMRNKDGDSVIALRLSPLMAVKVATALIGAAK